MSGSGSGRDGERRVAARSGSARRTDRTSAQQRRATRGASARGASGSGRPSRGRRDGRVRAGARTPVASARRWWRWGLVAVLALATVFVLVLFFTPVVGVRSVQVSGLRALEERRVVQAAGVEPGTPMLRVDEAAIRERVSRLSRVDSVRVTLSWPSTVRLEVRERVAVAVDVVSGGFRLVDAEGVVFATVQRRPAGLPEIRVPERAGEGARRSAMTVITALPDSVLGEVEAVVAERPDRVRLLLTRGRTVEWGSTRLTERKAAILPALLTREGKVYDVTSPALPTVS